MLQGLGTYLSLIIAFMLGYLIIKMYNFEHSLPDFQQIFDEFGGGISATFKEIVTNPTVKASFSNMGKQSGDVRAARALKKRVADTVVGKNLLLKKGLEYLDISSVEGLELMADPTLGPVIRNIMASLQDGASGLLSGVGGNKSGGQRSQRNDGNRVPNMS
ncbi:hypothetical protein ES705_23008 [subsurface metagenome]